MNDKFQFDLTFFGNANNADFMEFEFDNLSLKFSSDSFEFDALDHPSRIMLRRN